MNPVRLSISEAARLFGVSNATIRRAIKSGTLGYVVVRGRYYCTFDDVLKWSQKSARTQRKRDEDGIGQHVDKWKISNPLFSPNPKRLKE
jgi:excisionase family DNA binding protein